MSVHFVIVRSFNIISAMTEIMLLENVSSRESLEATPEHFRELRGRVPTADAAIKGALCIPVWHTTLESPDKLLERASRALVISKVSTYVLKF